jgi:hypothetical protein
VQKQTKPALELEPAFRSRLERKIAEQLKLEGIEVRYETEKVPYIVPPRAAKYLPDFILPNGIYIEAKGWLQAKDRAKMVHVRDSNPGLDIRFVFERAQNKIYKGSPTTYAKWCDDHQFRWADKGTIPLSWLREKKRKKK